MRNMLTALALLTPSVAAAQDHSMHTTPAPRPAQDHSAHGMPAQNQDHSAHGMPAPLEDGTAAENQGDFSPPLAHISVPGSGTARLPGAEGAMQGLHLSAGDWMVMAHGVLNLTYTDQGGPRGDKMTFLQSMAMLSASRQIGDVGLELRAMGSLEPAMGQRGYPNLFATGETAYGRPLVDRQHPHDLFMELSARVDVPLGSGLGAFLYGGPVAEPALGPSAFMHRRSARYLALSPISHHWFDSTHITYGVVTAGLRGQGFQLEGSAFKGREPDERRWNLDTPKLDSWSVRATLTSSPNWAVQLSHGRLKEPEALHGGDERRTTASVHYARGGFSAMLAFAAKDLVPGDTLTAWVGEANWDLSRHHSLFGRIENVANAELFPDHAHPLHDRAFRVTRFEGGYAYRVPLGRSAQLALGGSVAAYAKPRALDAYYGRKPVSGTLFARLSLGD